MKRILLASIALIPSCGTAPDASPKNERTQTPTDANTLAFPSPSPTTPGTTCDTDWRAGFAGYVGSQKWTYRAIRLNLGEIPSDELCVAKFGPGTNLQAQPSVSADLSVFSAMQGDPSVIARCPIASTYVRNQERDIWKGCGLASSTDWLICSTMEQGTAAIVVTVPPVLPVLPVPTVLPEPAGLPELPPEADPEASADPIVPNFSPALPDPAQNTCAEPTSPLLERSTTVVAANDQAFAVALAQQQLTIVKRTPSSSTRLGNAYYCHIDANWPQDVPCPPTIPAFAGAFTKGQVYSFPSTSGPMFFVAGELNPFASWIVTDASGFYYDLIATKQSVNDPVVTACGCSRPHCAMGPRNKGQALYRLPDATSYKGSITIEYVFRTQNVRYDNLNHASPAEIGGACTPALNSCPSESMDMGDL